MADNEPSREEQRDTLRTQLQAAQDSGRPIQWTQHHRPYPPLHAGGPEALTSWVDVRLLGGIDEALGYNWSVTLEGSAGEVYEADHMFDTIDDIANFDLDDDGARAAIVRDNPWVVWVDYDCQVHKILPSWRSKVAFDPDDFRVRGDVPANVSVYPDELAITVQAGSLLSADDLELLTAARNAVGDKSAIHVISGGWTTGRVSETLALWAYAWSGLRPTFEYVDLDETSEPDPLLEKITAAMETTKQREADIETARQEAGEDGHDTELVGGFPVGVPWSAYPSCGWHWFPDDALWGEEPSHCIRPASDIGIDGTQDHTPDPAPNVVGGGKSHPAGVPACTRHLEHLHTYGYTVITAPERGRGN